MAVRNPAEIRNVALIGTASAGKTTLVERLLLTAGAIKRMGSVEEGTTVTDFTDEEKRHRHSLQSAVAYFEHAGRLVHAVDTPGLADLIGHAITSLPAVETAMVVLDAQRGVETSARRMMSVAASRRLPRVVVINKIDMHDVDIEGVVESVRRAFGSACLPVNLPARDLPGVIDVLGGAGEGEPLFSSIAEARQQVLEQVVEVDDALMAEYLEKGAEALDVTRVHAAYEKALREGHLVPVCFVSAKTGAGAPDLLRFIVEHSPSPLAGNPRTFLRTTDAGEEETHAVPDPERPLIAHVFKLTADPFVGKLGVFRVHQGVLRPKDQVYIGEERKPLRIGHIFKLRGKEHVDCEVLGPGEIGAVAKIEEVTFGGVLHAEPRDVLRLLPLPLPRPMFGLAVSLTNPKDEAKFQPAAQKLMAEDPTFVVERVAATRQTVARGLGEMHLRVMLERLKNQFGIAVETATPRVAYKETITAPAEGHHRHKKQTGGAGEFGEVFLRVLPLPRDHPEGFEFENCVVGGNIPRQFMPAIEKGVRQALVDGAVAGYPMFAIRVEVTDGKTHPVDSKESAFIKAGKKAFIDAVHKASPVLLEPYVSLEITVPSANMGDVAAHLSNKRGRVLDQDTLGTDAIVVRATAPLAEVQNYANELKSMTGGAGSFTMDYSHDERTPAHIQSDVIAAYKPREED